MCDPVLKAVCERIRKESSYWDSQQAALDGVSRDAGALNINEAVTVFAPLAVAVGDVVSDVQLQLSKGTSMFGSIAKALTANAQAYEDHDADVSQHIKDGY